MSSASSAAFARRIVRQLNAVRRHALSLLAYSWHWQRPHLISWAGSVIVVGSLMALAATVQLTVTLVGGAVEREMQSASQIQVFLADEAKPEDVSGLTAQVKAIQGVKGVQYRSKAEAAKLARQDSQLAPLSNGTQSNPYPATLVVDVQDPAAGGRVAEAAQKSAAADRQVPVSYTPEDARKLSRILDVLRFAALALDLGVALVATMAALRLFRFRSAGPAPGAAHPGPGGRAADGAARAAALPGAQCGPGRLSADFACSLVARHDPAQGTQLRAAVPDAEPSSRRRQGHWLGHSGGKLRSAR